MKKPDQRQKIVGNYELGHQSVQLVLRDGNGGEFYTVPEVGSTPRIKVGADGKWFRVVEILHHEAMELAMTMVGVRFCPAPDNGMDNGGYLFVMNHTQFAEASARTAQFMAACLPDLARAYRRFKK